MDLRASILEREPYLVFPPSGRSKAFNDLVGRREDNVRKCYEARLMRRDLQRLKKGYGFHYERLAEVLKFVGLRLDPPAQGDIRETVIAAMGAKQMTPYALAKTLDGKVKKRSIFRFLGGKFRRRRRSRASPYHFPSMNLDSLGHVLDVLGFKLVPTEQSQLSSITAAPFP